MALDIALKGMNVGAGDEVITTPRTFLASASSIVTAGAKPVFADVEHGFYVIEDCVQAHGAKYKGRSVGSIGHAGAWSFCQDKIMSTGGEGGMVTTNDETLWKAMWSYKDHGKSWDAIYNQ